MVTDSAGFTLYRFDKDSATPPTATSAGDCATLWPPAAADGTAVTVNGIGPERSVHLDVAQLRPRCAGPGRTRRLRRPSGRGLPAVHPAAGRTHPRRNAAGRVRGRRRPGRPPAAAGPGSGGWHWSSRWPPWHWPDPRSPPRSSPPTPRPRWSPRPPPTGSPGRTPRPGPWGSRVTLELSGVPGPITCDLIAVSDAGVRQTVTTWSVPATVHSTGGTALPPATIDHFEVRTLDTDNRHPPPHHPHPHPLALPTAGSRPPPTSCAPYPALLSIRRRKSTPPTSCAPRSSPPTQGTRPAVEWEVGEADLPLPFLADGAAMSPPRCV
ncbi:hypothetical protein [Kitasatospora purpeofusca]|uniref:hypothetical protein n=1 Tax=Kitasatospora purpeofusca TaxID=67352 RepID=UPI002A5A2EA1|nr:hypothetical protein [Kitasatospora purpeofusca]MDY0813679.1 hypothetical protein [Kitasatospora purpeofusca]